VGDEAAAVTDEVLATAWREGVGVLSEDLSFLFSMRADQVRRGWLMHALACHACSCRQSPCRSNGGCAVMGGAVCTANVGVSCCRLLVQPVCTATGGLLHHDHGGCFLAAVVAMISIST
jgi:hypothetical protein